LEELENTLNEIEGRKKTNDIVAFLFSLFGNKQVNGNDALNFQLKLSQNKKMKYVFILFYGSVLYFIAKSMKIKSHKRHLTYTVIEKVLQNMPLLMSNK